MLKMNKDIFNMKISLFIFIDVLLIEEKKDYCKKAKKVSPGN